MTVTDPHKALVRSWHEHKDRTGMTQLKAAQQLGIGQSAFAQYLKGKSGGGISLNDAFVNKYCAMIGKEPSDLGWEGTPVAVKTQFIPIRYTSVGEKVEGGKLAVDSFVASGGSFAINVVSCDTRLGLVKGDYIICSDGEVELYAEALVWAVSVTSEGGHRSYIGRLSESGGAWGIAVAHNDSLEWVPIADNTILFRIVGTYMGRGDTNNKYRG